VILLAEMGDLSDITMANLAARYHDPVAVGIGSVLGLWLVAALAITGGRGLLRILPMGWISRLAAGDGRYGRDHPGRRILVTPRQSAS
jgi:putative Ca2+/H+ antiporter (TMEM165/GDT1 family)